MMITQDQAKQFHDLVSRGESLSPEQQAQLDEWYAMQDAAESNMLGLTRAESSRATLQAQVDAALLQLISVTRRIQQVASENEILRREIAALRQQVAQLAPQSA